MYARAGVLVAIAAVVAGAVAALPAAASTTQISVIEDDHLFLNSGAQERERALNEARSLGATAVHVLVRWSRLAPAPRSRTRPALDLNDPASYGDWSALDGLVAGARARGLRLLLTPTGPGPLWASQCTRTPQRGPCLPRVSDYGHFVHALGVRYSGDYGAAGQTLPAVDAWSIWNEPNHRRWLAPQTVRRGGYTIYTAAARYRQLALAGLAALTQTGPAGDLRLVGETAPSGGAHATPPVDFYRALFCLDAGSRPLRGAAARRQECAQAPRFPATGIAHHPYTGGAIARPSSTGRSGDVPIAALGRLSALLDHAAHYGIIRRRAPIYVTEFGYQTHPPDAFGVTLAQQAEYLNYADYIAYRNPRIASVAQYELRDDRARSGFNTGLRFSDGRPKPALAAYALPIYVTRADAGHVSVFGLARSSATFPARVDIQARSSSRRRFRTVAHATTNRAGYFLVRVPAAGRYWRLALTDGATTRLSRIASAR
jgi:hypothetical protein